LDRNYLSTFVCVFGQEQICISTAKIMGLDLQDLSCPEITAAELEVCQI